LVGAEGLRPLLGLVDLHIQDLRHAGNRAHRVVPNAYHDA
jgi:hypothetical protein